MKKSKCSLAIIVVFMLTSFSVKLYAQDQIPRYAYVSIEGRLFSKKLKVVVDLGDTPDQIKMGKEYSDKLSEKKSFAAVLNYMVENQFELVETLDYSYNYEGSGGTSGIVFIMKQKK